MIFKFRRCKRSEHHRRLSPRVVSFCLHIAIEKCCAIFELLQHPIKLKLTNTFDDYSFTGNPFLINYPADSEIWRFIDFLLFLFFLPRPFSVYRDVSTITILFRRSCKRNERVTRLWERTISIETYCLVFFEERTSENEVDCDCRIGLNASHMVRENRLSTIQLLV